MKIVLVAINARYTHTNIALRYLRNQALAHQSAPETILREYLINQPLLDIVEDLRALDPDIILFSVYIWNSTMVEALIPDLKALMPTRPIILGGPEVSYNAESWLERIPGIDLVVSGPGEGVFNELLDKSFALASWPTKIASKVPPHFSSIRSPWLAGEAEELPGRYLYVETSRGCPFACAYCLSSREDQPLEQKTAEASIAELEVLLSTQPLLIKFVDRTFNAHPGRARQIWNYLIDWSLEHPGLVRKQNPTNPDKRRKPSLPEPTRFHFEIQGALLQEEDYRVLSRAPEGIFQFEMGVQTSLGSTLKAINRTIDWPRTRAAALRIIELGTIKLHLDMIVGLPGESMADIAATFNDIAALGPQHFQMGFLKGLPGTALGDRAEHYGILYQSKAPYQILSNKHLASNDLARLRRIEKLTDTVWASGHFTELLSQAAKSFGGLFQALDNLAAWSLTQAMDLQIRDPAKLQSWLEDWLRKV